MARNPGLHKLRLLGGRARCHREARDWNLKDTASLSGCSGSALSKWERAEQGLRDTTVAAVAAAYKVSVEHLHAPGEAEAVLTLLQASGAVLERQLDGFEGYGGAIVTFLVFLREGRFYERAAVLCAPIVGGCQVRAFLKRLSGLSCVHHVLFVSEEEPDPSAWGALRVHKAPPDLHLLTLPQLQRELSPLGRLAKMGAALATSLPTRRFEPPARDARGELPRRRVGEALLRWATDLDGPCHLLLVGGPGSGKTTAARALVATLAREYLESGGQGRCPVYLALGDMIERADAWQWALHELKDRLGLASTHPVEAALAQGQLLLVLDGLEEVAGHDPQRLYAIERSLEVLMRYPGRVLLTARTPLLFGHEPKAPPEDRLPVRTLRLDPLESDDVEFYLSRLAPELRRDLWKLIHAHRMEELARRPYILDILHRGADLYRRKFIDGRPVLYELLDRTYHCWADADARSFRVSLTAMRALLGHLAAELKLRGRARGRADDLPPMLAQILFPDAGPDGLAPPAPTSSRFLHLQDRTFSFLHPVQLDFWFCSWVIDQILAGRPEALRHLWLGPHDLTLLCGMLRDGLVVDRLCAWALEPGRALDLRELFAYLLAFAGDSERGLAALRRILDGPEPESLRENAAFSAVVLGDELELERCLSGALAGEPSEARTSRRTQLVVLAIHEQHLPAAVRARVVAALHGLDADELAREQEAVMLDEGASATRRAASITALARVGGDAVRPLLMDLIDAFVSQGEFGRPQDLQRLAMAARRALAELDQPRLVPGPKARQGSDDDEGSK